ncbi:MAG: hypothetical protein LBF55_02535 [Prevotellaceae bacterium]|jgi:hypothetical protein|nr:hypothetical protein [Prevotellaceae bacterium]
MYEHFLEKKNVGNYSLHTPIKKSRRSKMSKPKFPLLLMIKFCSFAPINQTKMKEELTTMMHLELCKDEQEAMDLRVMHVTAVVEKRGFSPENSFI